MNVGNRRRAVRLLVAFAMVTGFGTLAVPATTASAAPRANLESISISEDSIVGPVRPTLPGFSIEGASICYVIGLANSDPAFVQLFKNLGTGILRVGGSTSGGTSTWATTGAGSCARRAMVVTPTLVDEFFAFAQSIGYKVMWEVPDYDDPATLAAEAAYVSTKSNVYSIEIGNEPDQQPTSDWPSLIQEWGAIDADYIADGGTAPVTGPATNGRPATYLNEFLAQDSSSISAVSEHFYGGDAANSPSCTSLLSLGTMQTFLSGQVADLKSQNLPFIVNETTTDFSAAAGNDIKGAEGVSNAFCAALWSANYLLLAQHDGVSGVYFHGTPDYADGNSGGQATYYSPINLDGTPAPLYYGMLYYREMTIGGGNEVATSGSGDASFNTFATVGTDGKLRVALLNLGPTRQVVAVSTEGKYKSASKIALRAPRMTSLDDVTLGGSSVGSDGGWAPSNAQAISPSAPIAVPPHTAVIVTYSAS